MPRITDTVLDEDGRPVHGARVAVEVLVSGQVPPTADVPGQPSVRRLVWQGRTDQAGRWEADLPAQSHWGADTFYTASVRELRRRVRGRDEFTVADVAGVVQRVRDRLRPDRPRRPRPNVPDLHPGR